MNDVYYKKYLKYKSLYLNLKSTGGANPSRRNEPNFIDLNTLLSSYNKNIYKKSMVTKKIFEIVTITQGNSKQKEITTYEITTYKKLEDGKSIIYLYKDIQKTYGQTTQNLISTDLSIKDTDQKIFTIPEGSRITNLEILAITDGNYTFYINKSNLNFLIAQQSKSPM